MKIAIIKYNAGNVCSVDFALQRLGIQAIITDNPEEIRSADKVIFPGVGEAHSAMKYLKDQQLDKVIKSLTQPTLGICLGMQLLCNYSEESFTDCLGIIPISIKKFTNKEYKIPHMGWNEIYNLKSPLFKNVNNHEFMYFVHSFYAEKSPFSIADCDYGLEFSASLMKNNFYAVQFHPEKSGDIGEQIISNFINL